MEQPEQLMFALDGARDATGETLSPAWLWVRGGRVEQLAGHPPTAAPVELPTLRGGWVSEPLADAHVHLFLCGAMDAEQRRRTAGLTRDEALERVLHLLEHYRGMGIAAVRDGGDPWGLALEAARVANPRPEHYAAVLPAGEAVFRQGQYGSFLGRGCGSLAEARRILEANRSAGATHAKILATGLNSLEIPGEVGDEQFSPAELADLIAAARSLEMPTMVHANGPLAGVLSALPDSVEHGFWHDPEDRDRMAADQVRWVPTLGAWAQLRGNPALTDQQRQVVEVTDAKHREEVRASDEIGVPVAVGSDAGSPGVPHGEGLIAELRHLSTATGSAAAALAAARRSLALCQAETDRPLGGLQPGQPAGFLWLERDPARDLDTLRRPKGVFLGTRWSPAAAATEGDSGLPGCGKHHPRTAARAHHQPRE